jgi:nicotinate phosphoribosyltransferase
LDKQGGVKLGLYTPAAKRIMTVNHRLGPLFTDLYELTMAAGYFEHRLFDPATFSLFIRNYPPQRNYFVAAGLQDALQELESLRFAEEDISFLDETGLFNSDFLSYLKQLRFTGDVFALSEGTIFFANEPILEITAPLIEAQIIETFILNTIGFQTLIASKAARCVHSASGRQLIDFSLRRTQGHDAGIKVARSTYIAGFAGTSNVLAGKEYGIPISGTMAHSYVQALGDDFGAFKAYADSFPDNSVFLIDTFDTLSGASEAIKVATQMKQNGHMLRGVRLDSGDMAQLSRQVRHLLDEAGLEEVRIFASSGFDEYKIDEVLKAGAKIDAFGVGTTLGVSADAPFVDIVYKMVRFGQRNVRKLSPGKETLGGEKQVFRFHHENGLYRQDIIDLRNETHAAGSALLELVMESGRRVQPLPSLENIRQRFKRNFADLSDEYKDLAAKKIFPVSISPRLRKLQHALDA